MTVDPRTPVVVGAGQVSQRPDDAADPLPPVELLAEAARLAAADACARRSLLSRVDTVAVVEITTWRYPDPGALLARRLGVEPRATLTCTTGGNSPQMLVNELGAAIARGEADIVLLGGAECMYTRWRARREPRTRLVWEVGDDPACPNVLGDARMGVSDHEMAHLALAPTQVYPLFETALRAAAGRTIGDHQRHVSELWAHFAAVAATNPHAWSRTAFSAEQIRRVTPDNRMVCFPYPKLMCSNIDVDQAAALLLCSYGTARDAGVPDDRIVFLHAGADAHDHFFFSNRWSLAEAPAIGAAVADALAAAALGLDDVARFDLYSCFPSAVQLALGATGLAGPTGGDPRPLTVTGGLGFAGGPVNNYVTHSIAAMVDALRNDPGSYGLTTGLGWYATKHAVGVWSTRPPGRGYVRADSAATQARVDALPSRDSAGPFEGDVVVEATSVTFERDGTPSFAIVTGLTADGRRALANSRDAEALKSMVEAPWEGRPARLTTDGNTNTLAV